LHEDQHAFMFISCSLLLRVKNVSVKVVEKIKTRFFLCPITFFENRAFYVIMWENYGRVRPQMTIWRMRITCWIPKATNTHSGFTYSESVIAFPLQQWLHEGASLLRYMYSACLSG